ncbi:MAG: FtsX-like permease family protein [Solobacterium sp.]|nr:FtsX-like permease family protein [Solobacterium sp.]
MKNPLRKRLLRDLGKDWKKYLVLLVLMAFMIGIASGVFVGNNSMKVAISESYEKYNIEHGHFELKEKATTQLIKKFEDEKITLFEQFYKDTSEIYQDHEGIVRLFKVRKFVNKPCLMEGKLPQKDNEIAIDRAHADNLGIKVEDLIKVGGKDYTVVGLIASPDYSCLFENNADLMFNALTFEIGFLSEEAWEKVNENIKYQYAFSYNEKPKDEIEEKEKSDALVEHLAVLALSGGYTNDKEEAEALTKQVDAWIETLEEAEAKATSLEERGKALQKRQEDLMAQMQSGNITPTLLQDANTLQEEANALQKEAEELEAKKEEYEKIADELKELEPYEENQNEVVDYVPSYANQSIHFAENDLGKDQAMMNVLVYVFIAVLAFVFAITTSNKIKEESAIIGTLRATGYSKEELIRYYMLIPITITLLAAILGNILGYTYFKDVAVALYYNSYSLLKYETIWNAKAFLITTFIPLVLMILINYIVIARLMKLSPLKFLRHDLSQSKRKKAMRLPSISFMNRFRLRILLQNAFDYLTLFLGLVFIAILLGFSIGLPETIQNYKNIVTTHMLADYQTILKDYKDEDTILTTSAKGAERFATTSLFTIDGTRVDESITIYGYEKDSKRIQISEDLTHNEVYISDVYQEKFGYQIGDTITLKEKYEKKQYEFIVKGIHTHPSGLAVFLPIENYNALFEKEKDYFTGYFSDEEIKDIDPDQIYTVITIDDVTTLANQLDHSMGGFADYISYACLLIGILVMYLLTKLIIEKNAISISVLKVLGYEDADVNRLYVRLTTIVVVLLTLLATVVGIYLIIYLFRLIMNSMEGWFALYMSPLGICKMIGIILLSYLVVSFLDMRQIRKIPLTEALKNVE